MANSFPVIRVEWQYCFYV